ncbi:hypothetical protein G6O67_001120 [Ophiocordyceps sinensis]|uniref:Uncharacterized protein n=1 Tax=Ophiocordyceps sinensis TaxID=72228 RepID=A0A8H4V8K3_9HYPO|nr:hypothetical protein G6O67_001120 [Ophiocordyceps sinensis]
MAYNGPGQGRGFGGSGHPMQDLPAGGNVSSPGHCHECQAHRLTLPSSSITCRRKKTMKRPVATSSTSRKPPGTSTIG